MRWSEAQQAMLREMGLRQGLPMTTPSATVHAAAVHAAAVNAAAIHAAAAPAAAVHATVVASPPDAAPTATLTSARSALPPPNPTDRPGQERQAVPVVRAPASGVAGMDWSALRHAVTACRACTLCDGRRQTVFGTGHPRAHWLIVGEAPGEQEDALGEPFVGESGQLLDRMLRALGLTREAGPAPDPARQVFIANTLKCRPPGNRNPTAQELAACQPYLERQVTLLEPRVILAMGRFAVQALLGSSEPLGRLRGRVHDWRGVPLVVTYHPAYLLRQPAEKARAWEDLCLAASCLVADGG